MEIYTPLGPTIKEQASRSCLGVLSPFSYCPHNENTVAWISWYRDNSTAMGDAVSWEVPVSDLLLCFFSMNFVYALFNKCRLAYVL